MVVAAATGADVVDDNDGTAFRSINGRFDVAVDLLANVVFVVVVVAKGVTNDDTVVMQQHERTKKKGTTTGNLHILGISLLSKDEAI